MLAQRLRRWPNIEPTLVEVYICCPVNTNSGGQLFRNPRSNIVS